MTIRVAQSSDLPVLAALRCSNGIGAQLLRTIEQDAVSLGFSKLLLNPTDKAIPLYERCGYRPADWYLVHDLQN